MSARSRASKAGTPAWTTNTGKKEKGTPEPKAQGSAPVMRFSFETHCKSCQEILGDTANLGCDQCGRWFHQACTRVSQQEFDIFTGSSDNIQYFCDDCTPNRGLLKGLEKRIEDLLAVTTDLRDRLERAEAGDSPLLKLKIEEIVKKELKEVMEERDEQERRAPNLIIVNIPESNRENVDDRKKDDEKLIRETLKKTELNVGELNDVTIIARLGREPTNGIIRPIKIQINNPLTKAKVLRNGRLINSRDCAAADRIYVNKDLTQSQREQGKALRDELKDKRRTQQDRKWTIRNDKVVELRQDDNRNDDRNERVDGN